MTEEITGLEDVVFESASQYRILEEIARGGMGVVYLAERECVGVKDLVVLKTIRSVTPEDEAELRREANIATQLRHVNIVKTYGLEAMPTSALPPRLRKALRGKTRVFRRSPGGERTLLWIVMDYIFGTDLHRLVRQHLEAGYLIPSKLAAYVAVQMCRALAYAHNRIVHRDMSPDNVLIDPHGICKLSDFGIAVARHGIAADIAGKSLYMAPECYTEERVDARSDQFSLGICLYYALTGIQPIWTSEGLDVEDQMIEIKKILRRGIPAPHLVRPDIPETISRIVMRMIERDPGKRYNRIGMVGDEIEHGYLYDQGFGPTNNSLAAYIRFFESGFRESDTDDVLQMSFLRDASGRMSVQRPLRIDDYTDVGIAMIEARSGSLLHHRIDELRRAELRARERQPRRPMIMVKYGENLFETFLLSDGALIAGGDAGCDVLIPGAAARHARISPVADGAVVEDLGGGIHQDGRALERVVLAEGNRVRVAGSRVYFLRERLPEKPRRWIDLAGGAPIDVDGIDPRSATFRFRSDADTRQEIRRVVGQLCSRLDMSARQIDVLRDSFDRTINFLAGPAGRSIEVRTFSVPTRMVIQISDLEASDLLIDLLTLLKNDSLSSDTDETSPAFLMIDDIDRIEYRHFNRALRLTKGL